MKNILIDFALLATDAARALRKVTQQFQRAGLPVLKAESDGRNKRTASISYREAVLSFEDSQQVLMRIKASGDIYQVLINGRLTPIKDQDDHAAAIKEIVAKLDKGRQAYQKRLAAMQMKPPEGIKTAAPKLKDALQAQLKSVTEQIAAAESELAQLQPDPAR